MSEAVLAALIGAGVGAVFNAGVMWGLLRGLISRIERAEVLGDGAHKRIDNILVIRAGGTD